MKTKENIVSAYIHAKGVVDCLKEAIASTSGQFRAILAKEIHCATRTRDHIKLLKQHFEEKR